MKLKIVLMLFLVCMSISAIVSFALSELFFSPVDCFDGSQEKNGYQCRSEVTRVATAVVNVSISIILFLVWALLGLGMMHNFVRKNRLAILFAAIFAFSAYIFIGLFELDNLVHTLLKTIFLVFPICAGLLTVNHLSKRWPQ